MPFPAFSRCGCNLHLAFVCFWVFQRCILIVLIYLFVIVISFSMHIFFGSSFGSIFNTLKVAGGHVHNSQGKFLVPSPLSDSPGICSPYNLNLTGNLPARYN